MDVEQLQADAIAGKISAKELVEVIFALQKRVEELEAQIKAKNPTERLDEAYSEKADEDRMPNKDS